MKLRHLEFILLSASLSLLPAPGWTQPDLRIAGKIVFVSNRDGNDEIYAMSADGSGQTRLTSSPGSDSYPALSPDGAKIAFASNRDGNYEIYVMNVDGTDQTRLTSSPGYNAYPSWSPDGARLVFVSTRDGNNEIYTMNPDGSGQTRLTVNTALDGEPVWSPDGNRIAFYSIRDGDNEVYVMNADGTGVTQLTQNSASEGEPAWSPDGSRMALNSTRDGGFAEIYVMNADGTGATRLTNHLATDGDPSWSPDGKRIAFDSYRNGNYEIYVMNADGAGLTRLTANSALDAVPSWGLFQHVGSAAVSTPISRVMTVENRGAAALNVSSITFGDGQFTATPLSFSITAGGSQDVTVTFTPTSLGTKYSTMTIISNDPQTPTIALTVNGTGIWVNRPPAADAGPDQTLFVGDIGHLNGSASSDPDDDPLSYRWEVLASPAGSNAALSDPASPDPTMTPDLAGAYILQLTVNDGHTDSDPDRVTVTAQTPQQAAQEVITQINDLVSQGTLNTGQANAMTAKLDAAIQSVDAGHTNTAVNQLNAFINQVEAQRGKKLTDAQADALIAGAQEIISHLSPPSGMRATKPAPLSAEGFGLSNHPNPFNPATTIRYALPEAAHVTLVVYNVLGQQVRTLVNAAQDVGFYSVQWDGRDASGRAVSSGMYVYRLEAGANTAVGKVILSK